MPSKPGNDLPALNGLREPIWKRHEEDLKQALRMVMLRAGIRAKNIPEGEEKVVLLEYIRKYYGRHTPEEITRAFDMAFTHELDLPEKEIPCYENFSCQYFSKIMDAYRRALARYEESRPIGRPLELPAPPMDQEAFDQEMQEWLNGVIIQVQADVDPEFIPYLLYEWLEKKKVLIPEGPEIVAAIEKAVNRRLAYLRYMARENHSYDNKKALEVYNAMVEKGVLTGDESEITFRLAKSILLKEFIIKQHLQQSQNQQDGKADKSID